MLGVLDPLWLAAILYVAVVFLGVIWLVIK
jgi:hypothetical protein